MTAAQVERSFRMATFDLATRPVFHRLRDSIEAHLTVVPAALAVSREAQARTRHEHQQVPKILRPADRDDQPRQAADHVPPHIPAEAQRLLDNLKGGH
jgi:hypothetical protein